MSKNIGKIIRVDSLPPKMDRFTNVIYQVSVPNTATYIDYAIDENGDVKTPTLDKKIVENYFSKIKTVDGKEPDENGNIQINSSIEKIGQTGGLFSKGIGSLNNISQDIKNDLSLNDSIFLGTDSGANMTNASNQIAIENSQIIAIGKNTFKNVDIQFTAGVTAIGYAAYENASKGNGTIAIGYCAGRNINAEKVSGSGFNVLLGSSSGANAGKLSSVIAIGTNSASSLKEGYNSVVLGQDAGQDAEYISNDILVGPTAGRYLKKDVNSGYCSSIGIGREAYGGFGVNGITQSMSIYVGYQAGGSPGIGQRNIGIGVAAGRHITGTGNIAIGSYFENNTPLGAGRDIAGNNNIILGGRAGVTTKGDHNFIVGYYIGTDTSGNSNVNILGSRGLYANNTIIINTSHSNSSAYTPVNGTLNIGGTITGNILTKKVGIGLPITDVDQIEPREVLDVNGYIASDGIKIDSGSFQSTLDTQQLTGDVVHKLPNKSGTVALLEDINLEKIINILFSATEEEKQQLKTLLN